MTSPASFEGPLPGRRGRAPATVVALIVAFIALALAKPWAGPSPAPSLAALPSAVAPSPSPSSSPASASAAPTFDPNEPIVLDAPPPADAAWTAVRWRRLAPGDPLATLRLVAHAAWGYLATGEDPASDFATRIWTSPDGVTWAPMTYGTATTLWPGVVVAGVGAAAGNLVVLTVLPSTADCGSGGTCGDQPGVDAWTSTDGLAWAPHHVPDSLATGPWPGVVNVAYGPRGLVVTWAGTGATGAPVSRLATSADGSTWRVLPATTLPSGAVIVDLAASGDGYLAVGRTLDASAVPGSMVLRSTDGRTWRRADPAGSAHLLLSLVTVPGAFVAIGRDPFTGIARWWRSTDGARWTALAGYPPLGPAACRDGCEAAQDGVLTGDGTRLLAIRGGADAAAWTSSDGSTWAPLRMTGDLPTVNALDVALLPGGVLVSDGASTWYGAATGG
jgi:hypothetical protein